MLKKIFNLLRAEDFAKKEDGNIFITTAFAAPLLVIAVAIGVDSAEVYRAKVNFQNAVDAATLVATKYIAAEGGGATAQAAARLAGRNVFAANMRNLNPDEGKANIDFIIDERGCGAGSVAGVATLAHRVYFNAFHLASKDKAHPDHVTLHAEAEVGCANNTVEIALVLDNSGSMGGPKLDAVEKSATELVTTLHGAFSQSPAADPIQFSLVPFNGAVNVGTNNINASWMDYQGINPNHHENFDWEKDPSVYFDGSVWRRYWRDERQTRFTMFSRLREPWRGCVENRPFPMNTNVEVPTQSNPITLFLPWFAPDEPDFLGGGLMSKKRSTDPNDKVTCTAFNLTNRGNPVSPDRQFCALWSDGLKNRFKHPQDMYYLPTYNDGIEYSEGKYIGDSTPGGAGPWVDDQVIQGELGTKHMGNSYLKDDFNFPLTIRDHPLATPHTGFDTLDTSNRGQFERQNWTWKYFREDGVWPTVDSKYWKGYMSGPNFGCTVEAMTPLTSNSAKIIGKLEGMVASGQTNIPQAIAWGWRTLTSTNPFPDGRDESNVNNKKVMIVMTDGQNYDLSAWDNGSIYGAYGFEKNGRRWEGVPTDYLNPATGGTRLKRAMNFHMSVVCENAKKSGISIHAIAFGIADGTFVKELLEECASNKPSGGKQYYDAKSVAELSQSFKEIALQLSELKLMR